MFKSICEVKNIKVFLMVGSVLLLFCCFLGDETKTEQTARKRGKSKSERNMLPAAPFRLSSADFKLADKRALNVCMPSGYGWKPCAFFCKKPYLKSHDWKQVQKHLYCMCQVMLSICQIEGGHPHGVYIYPSRQSCAAVFFRF